MKSLIQWNGCWDSARVDSCFHAENTRILHKIFPCRCSSTRYISCYGQTHNGKWNSIRCIMGLPRWRFQCWRIHADKSHWFSFFVGLTSRIFKGASFSFVTHENVSLISKYMLCLCSPLSLLLFVSDSISLQGSLICKWFAEPDLPEAHSLRERYIA